MGSEVSQISQTPRPFPKIGYLFEPKLVEWPLNDIGFLELCRHIEYLVAEQLGPALVAPFMHWWRSDSPAPSDKLLADRWRVVRNYLLKQLKKLPQKATGWDNLLRQMFL